ncbi:MAG: DUF1830 domain-containing protein [Cyanobacteria bacterium J06639_1]
MSSTHSNSQPKSRRDRYRYRNRSRSIQLIRIANIPRFFFEKTVLPGASVRFSAPAKSHLEIVTLEGSVTHSHADTVHTQTLTEGDRSLDRIADISMESSEKSSRPRSPG